MIKRFTKFIFLLSVSVCLLFLLTCALRVFVCDRFIIKGDSMSPTYESGEAVWVNKLLVGARIYTDLDFSSSELKAFRMLGFRKPKTGDVVIFNYPHGRDNYKIEFRINYVYAKRILGCPGDVIGIKDGICYKEGFDGTFGVKEIQELSRIHRNLSLAIVRVLSLCQMKSVGRYMIQVLFSFRQKE